MASDLIVGEVEGKVIVEVVGKLELPNMAEDQVREIIRKGNYTFKFDSLYVEADETIKDVILRALNLPYESDTPVSMAMKGRAIPSHSYDGVKHEFKRKGHQSSHFEYVRRMSLEKRSSLENSFEKKAKRRTQMERGSTQKEPDVVSACVVNTTEDVAVTGKQEPAKFPDDKNRLIAGSILDEMATYRSELASTRSGLTSRYPDELNTDRMLSQ